MRFMVAHKVTKETEAGGPVNQKHVEGMGELIGSSIKNGVFQNGAGLKPTKFRSRLTFKGGQILSIKDGPYQGTHELVAGFSMIKVKTKEEAIEWTRRFAQVGGDSDIELGLVVEGWDLTGAPRPADAPLRYLMLFMADKNAATAPPPSERAQKEMGALMDEMKKAGVLLWAEGVRPSAEAKRLTFKGGKHTVVDGPFAESKELISGFSLINVPTAKDALEWAVRYGTILGDIEVDLLSLYDQAAFSG